ncbi:slipin family protein [Saccharothrix deserti]|uniref:slipin family protein n=1 Tax=Saccharothrix deserti TaxID=2593674 RepID=UPI001EE40F69|nr:slipin family protein [Saccharothrix deserti]
MKHTLMPWERGVVFRHGELVDVLAPGRHRLRWRDVVDRVDVRPRSHTPAWQDIPTSDGVLIRVTLVVVWAVADPAMFVRTVAEPEVELHLLVQVALRTAVLTRAHDEVDPSREAIGAETLAAVAPRAVAFGIEVREVAVRDVVMPSELRKAALAELVARSEARAALERARGETAAFRSLLNAARLAEAHPALLELRALQSATTVVVNRPSTPT